MQQPALRYGSVAVEKAMKIFGIWIDGWMNFSGIFPQYEVTTLDETLCVCCMFVNADSNLVCSRATNSTKSGMDEDSD